MKNNDIKIGDRVLTWPLLQVGYVEYVGDALIQVYLENHTWHRTTADKLMLFPKSKVA